MEPMAATKKFKIAPEVKSQILDAPSLVLQNFDENSQRSLPKGVECLFRFSNNMPRSVPSTGMKTSDGRWSWSVVADEQEVGKKALKLVQENTKGEAFFAAKFDAPTFKRGEPYVFAVLMRSTGKPVHAQVIRESPMNPPQVHPFDQISPQWTMMVLVRPPWDQSNLKSIAVGFAGNGELEIGEFRIAQMPAPLIDYLKTLKPPGDGSPSERPPSLRERMKRK